MREQGVTARVLEARLQPVRRVLERIVRPELDHRPTHVLVAVADVDVPRARAIRGAGQRARERRVLDHRADEDGLALLDVRPDANRELGIALEAVVYSCHTSSRRIGTAVPSFVIPSTETSGPPIMKSVWIAELFMPRSRI